MRNGAIDSYALIKALKEENVSDKDGTLLFVAITTIIVSLAILGFFYS